MKKLLFLLLLSFPVYADQINIYFVCDQPAVVVLHKGEHVWMGTYKQFMDDPDYFELMMGVINDVNAIVSKTDVPIVECPVSA